MSKKGWKLLTGLLVLSLLLVSYFVLKNKNQEETEEEDVQAPPETVVEIQPVPEKDN